jgi:myo-inositol 2-dehydrogenase / D-chiro-inositol 1-dehydrogenase
MLGAGTMGRFHAETLRSLPEVSELRVYDVDPSRATVGSMDEALSGADCAVIVAPSATHAELIRLCVDRGLPTFCEKPIDVSLSVSLSVADHVRSARGAVMIGFQRRFDAEFGRVRAAVLDGSLGRIHGFAMSTYDRTPAPMSYVGNSGGVFRDMHIHDFDAVRWVFGHEVVEVSAFGSVLVDPGYGERDDVDTTALALRFADGMLGALSGGRLNPAGYIARLDVYGSKAMASVREDRPYRDFLDRYPDAYRAELAHFLRVARGEAEPAATVDDAVWAMRIAEAADASRRSGRPVKLEEIG